MDKIAVLDFGGQYAHLIANRIRRIGVYTEIHDGDISASELKDYKALILSGGPASVINQDSVSCDSAIFDLGIPILGICYGHQLMAVKMGGKVEKGKVREYGPAMVSFSQQKGVFESLGSQEKVWMNHFDQVVEVPSGFEIVASTEDCPITAVVNEEKKFYSMQFHPEVTHTACGMEILKNFVEISGAKKDWSIDAFIENEMSEIKKRVGNKKVFLMISGGVDSSVAFLLLEKALGPNRVYGLFVDTGFMRKNERQEVEKALREAGVENLYVYDAGEEYFAALKEVYEPEAKRKIIGDLFLDIQAKVSEELELNPDDWLLGQGTIYPDTIETGGTKHADKIKTHHNRVERVQKMMEEGKVIEPLAQLYKDEVRMVGAKLGLSEAMVWRHPFPGPGLAVRVLCSEAEDYPDNHEKIEQEMNQLLATHELKARILPIKSVGVQGDERSYRHPVLIYGKRHSWADLDSLATRLTNRFDEINRVVFGFCPDNFDILYTRNSYLEKPRILTIQEADSVVMNYLKEAKIDRDIWQFPSVLIPVSVGSQNGESIVLRPVCSQEAMTANFYPMDYGNLDVLLERLKKIEGVSGIFYDITNKPPGTIEWE